MKKQILKRLINTFLITLAASTIYSWLPYQATIGNEARQAMFLIVLIGVLLCILSFILSLTALLNLYSTIRQNFVKSMLSFLLLPSILFVSILATFLTNSKTRIVKEFLVIGYAPLLYVVILTYHFFRFRQTCKDDTKANS